MALFAQLEGVGQWRGDGEAGLESGVSREWRDGEEGNREFV